MPETGRIAIDADALVKVASMSVPPDDHESLRSRSEHLIAELAQAMLESQTLESALATALGAREKAGEAQQALLAALNLPSASDIERLERRLRSISQRLEDIEDQVDRVADEVGGLRRNLGPQKPGGKADAA
jgi:tetrahydromethanopterin S-methyltransferase subunit G